MKPQTIGPVVELPAGHAGAGLDARFPGKYLSLTSFKRDGTGVSTPVWFVIDDGHLLVKTDGQSFKAKRIRHNPAVTVAPCSGAGRLRSEPVRAQAEFLPQSEIPYVDDLMARKYRIDRLVILPVYRTLQRLRGAHAGGAEVALAITPQSGLSVRICSEDSR